MNPFERIRASMNLALALNVAGRFVPEARRDEFETAVAQVIGCVMGVSPDDARALGIKVRTELDAEHAAKKAAQS